MAACNTCQAYHAQSDLVTGGGRLVDYHSLQVALPIGTTSMRLQHYVYDQEYLTGLVFKEGC